MATNEFSILQASNAECRFSDVVFVESMRQDKTDEAKQNPLFKHGYIIKPLITNGAFVNADTLFFYVELYNAGNLIQEATFYLRARIRQGEKILYAYETVASRKRSQPFNIDFDVIDIRDLPSQTYYLQIDVLTEQNQIVKSMSKKFHVFNSRVEPEFDDYVVENIEADVFAKYTEEELDYYLNTLVHTSTEQEIRFRKALENFDQKKNYLYTYWEKRKSPEQSVASLWAWHLSALQYSNQHFKSALREGWQTDRGRVFLEHGIPSDVERFPSSSTTVPYEIWRYDRLGNQTNVIFVFFNPDVITDEYPLLHSSKYGEINNPGWKRQLVARGHVPANIDYENDNFDIPGTEMNRNK
jgi:GWxTD domain-containing protein